MAREYVSKHTGKTYRAIDVCRIRRVDQAAAQIAHGAILQDITVERGWLTFIFLQDETRALYDKWCMGKLSADTNEVFADDDEE